MTIEKLQDIINQGEGTKVEFKTASSSLNRDAFDSICGFLNRSGGHLILGVKDNGTIKGVQEDKLQQIVDGIVLNANNHQKLNPPYYLSPKVLTIHGKKLIWVYVPESSQVHATAGKIFDRNQDGDFNITTKQDLVAQLYLRKQNSYSENKVFPFVSFSDFKPKLFEKVRSLARSQQPTHPWLEMDDEALLRSAGLFKEDRLTGSKGYTLAAILLFGTEECLQSVLPHYKTDALVRIVNLDRYDDRDDIRSNLIESYERLMAFIAKHLPEKFTIVDGQRINVRDNLFREIIGNLLVHREFTNAFPAKLIIEKEQVLTENWNKPYLTGAIDPTNFSPYPKNPTIAKFFREIGWVDELGSGVRNTYKYANLYNAGTVPSFIEEDVFKVIVPLKEITSEKTREKIREKTREKTREKVIRLIKENKNISTFELAKQIGISQKGIEYHIARLRKQKLLKRIGPDRGGHWQVNDE